jgi:hypothetical protein
LVPTTIKAERNGPLLPATEKVIVPLPLALAPEVMVTKLWLVAAVQLHPAGAVTLMLPVPPLVVKFWLVALSAETQFVPVPSVKKGAIFG